MLTIGAHLSASKGYTAMLNQALEIGANTFQFFTRNPRGGSAKAIDENDVNNFLKLMGENGFPVILAHAPYTLNLCSAKPETREFATNTFADDLRRMEYTPNQLYNFHVLLETMAGKGTEIGRSFEELKAIIDKVELNDKIGVCLDTCHVNDAGYDIVNNLDGVLEEFDKIIGIGRLKAIHINDSKNPLGAHKDRHEKIGEGYIGKDAMERIINHPLLKKLPFYLETPNELDGYAKEIALLRSLYKD